MKTLESNLQHGGLALFLDSLEDFFAGLRDDLLDSGRMDPAVHDELVERDPRHLTADGIEAADNHGFRGVIDDQVDAGRLLEGPNVATLLADDAALQLVGRQGYNRDRNLRRLVGGDPLNRLSDDLSSALVALVSRCQLGLSHLAGDLVAQLLLDLRHQHSLGFLTGHIGDPLQFDLLLAVVVLQLGF